MLSVLWPKTNRSRLCHSFCSLHVFSQLVTLLRFVSSSGRRYAFFQGSLKTCCSNVVLRVLLLPSLSLLVVTASCPPNPHTSTCLLNPKYKQQAHAQQQQKLMSCRTQIYACTHADRSTLLVRTCLCLSVPFVYRKQTMERAAAAVSR